MGVKKTRTNRAAERDASRKFKLWVRNLWKHRAQRARARAVHVPHKSGWLCIHRYEGAWNSATGNGYYGGLQMDVGFQRLVRTAPASLEGHGEPLDAPRADVGRRARTPERSRLLPVAQHGAFLWTDLVSRHGPRLTSDQALAQRPAAQEEGSREARRPGGQVRRRVCARAPAFAPREAGQERRVTFFFSQPSTGLYSCRPQNRHDASQQHFGGCLRCSGHGAGSPCRAASAGSREYCVAPLRDR